jgi:phage shock protein PspC (stress-responsive transcriptional regulator)
VNDRLYRSPNDRVIAGVAGGLATWLRIDPSIVRVAWVILAILSGGIFVLVYIVMMIVVPLPPPGWMPSPPPGAWTASPGQWGGSPGQWSGSPGQWTATPPGAQAGQPPGAQPGQPPGAQPGPQPGQWTPPPGGAPTWNGPDMTNAGIVAGFVLVGLGIWFLIDQYVDIDWQLVWPVVVIAIGAALVVAAMRRSRPSG